ncbi:hypothetical protein GCM10027066_20780 [Dyella jejuensis]
MTETDKGENVSLEPIREKWYGQCWTKKRDTDAMWRIYSHNKDGIRVQSTPRKLIMSLRNTVRLADRGVKCFIGTVEYKKKDAIEAWLEGSVLENVVLNNGRAARTLLVKREEFEHENEVRILYQDIWHTNHETIFKYDFDFESVIDEVATDPRSGVDEPKMLEWYLKSFNISTPVVRSPLYEGVRPIKIRSSIKG